MKYYHSLIVFFLLALSASVTSLHSYNVAKDSIISDMNQALAQTLSGKTVAWITPDTIHTYRQNLKIEALRDNSFLSYAQKNSPQALSSKPIVWKNKANKSVAFQSYATCSFATIWKLSDQRSSTFFLALLILWTISYTTWIKKHKAKKIIIGQLAFAKDDQTFYNQQGEAISFTPMQEQLMLLFMANTDLKLSKQAICDHLWHKKPDASETLYTLVRRLRPVLQNNAKITISSDNKGNYYLTQL